MIPVGCSGAPGSVEFPHLLSTEFLRVDPAYLQGPACDVDFVGNADGFSKGGIAHLNVIETCDLT